MNIKIYKDGRRAGRFKMYVQPGNEIKEVSEWFDCDNQPILFTVVFNDGVAIVPQTLGNYIVDRGLASRSPIIIPNFLDQPIANLATA